ncbi:MAG: hypothetical protein ACXQT5_05420 [Candidatus Syntropharchaeia archaeon]
MVVAGKIFRIPEGVDIEGIAQKLKDFSTEEIVETEKGEITLIKEIRDLEITSDSLKGIFSEDYLMEIPRRGEIVPVLSTKDASFIFSRYKGKIILTILEKKTRANNIANQLSKIIFIAPGKITEAKIEPSVLRRFHEENLEDTKVVFFDDVDLPNINKLSLYGSMLRDTILYEDYCSHGKLWYIVIKSKKHGYVVGLTRNCIVTIFSKAGEEEFMDYVRKEIYPLIFESELL